MIVKFHPKNHPIAPKKLGRDRFIPPVPVTFGPLPPPIAHLDVRLNVRLCSLLHNFLCKQADMHKNREKVCRWGRMCIANNGLVSVNGFER